MVVKDSTGFRGLLGVAKDYSVKQDNAFAHFPDVFLRIGKTEPQLVNTYVNSFSHTFVHLNII